jgi:hypothetical protein
VGNRTSRDRCLGLVLVAAVVFATGVATAHARPTDGARDPLGDGYRLGKTGVRHHCFRMHASGGRTRTICVHWVKRTSDAPPAIDRNRNGVPDQVDDTIQTLRKVWRVEVRELGYRAPRPDRGPRADQGPNRGIDIYLANIGAEGGFGYCTTDHRSPAERRQRTAPAYCVLDDDFSKSQFHPPSVHGKDALKVTAAHEFFHAVQFAYDYSHRDQWLREGTAVWMEDEVYGGVHANYDFLDESPLAEPEVPLDTFGAPDTGQNPEYGAWTFWRFLTEYLGTPDVVRDVWEQVGHGRGAWDATAQAVRRPAAYCLLQNHCGVPTLGDAVAEFQFWNLLSSNLAYWGFLSRKIDVLRGTSWHSAFPRTYEEADGYRPALPPLPTDAEFDLAAPRHSSTGTEELRIDHMASRSAAILVESDGQFQVHLDAPPPEDGAQASIAIVPLRRPLEGNRYYFPLDDQGSGGGEFTGPAVVVLLFSNTSRTRDHQPYRFDAELVG